MLRRSSILLLFLLSSLFCSIPLLPGNDRNELWQLVDKAGKDGLPKTAIKHLKKIIDLAVQDEAYVEACGAITKKIVLEGNIQGNKPEEKIIRLKEVIKNSAPSIKPLLNTTLAIWYWHYYKRNRWRFLRRSKTVDLKNDDIKTWDLAKIFKEIDKTFQLALKSEERLKQYPLKNYLTTAITSSQKSSTLRQVGFIQPGNLSKKLRPTLFDFIAFAALDFYSAGEQGQGKVQDAFEIAAKSDALSNYEKFLKYKPVTEDRDNVRLKAIRLYQKLIAFHLESGNDSALVDADLHRLLYIKNNSYGSEKNKRYKKRLHEIATNYSHLPLSSLALYYLARNSKEKGELVKAVKLAEAGNKRFPNSPGGQNCKALINQIKAKNVNMTAERVVARPYPEIKIRYKNFTRLYFKAIKDDWRRQLNNRWGSVENFDNHARNLVYSGAGLVKEWEVSLKATPDYKEKVSYQKIPELAPGFYRIFASYKKNPHSGGNNLSHCSIWVTRMAMLVQRGRNRVRGFILNNRTGKPISAVKVTAFQRNKRGYYEKTETVHTSKNGFFRFDNTGGYNRSKLLLAEDDGEELLSPNEYYPSGSRSFSINNKVTFFTDRALYRPGQSIHFKGILARVDHQNDDYQVLENRQVRIVLRDANYQQVEKLNLVSNDFGSFSGTFTAPVGRLTGQMTIIADHYQGNARFRVEEYKRPKFEVKLDSPEKAYRLGEMVTIKGGATAYTGAPIDSAKVKFRVTRKAQLPWYCRFYYYPSLLNKSDEIASGRAKTDSKGRLSISFKAIPDNSFAPENNPVFVYDIYVEVIDSTGETRTATLQVRLGYNRMEISLQSEGSDGNWKVVGRKSRFKVFTRSLNGQGQQAEGNLEIYRLNTPKKPIRKRFDFSHGDKDLSNPVFTHIGEIDRYT
ncbi:MG2 domain-containing protein, partial [Candidatus Riflebacteria bacterium]